jgi:hypothetical protein
MSPRRNLFAPAVSETRRERESNCVNHGRDAAGGRSPTSNDANAKGTERDGQADALADDDATPADDETDETRRHTPLDPDSPGATIDSPTPAEPNEPG